MRNWSVVLAFAAVPAFGADPVSKQGGFVAGTSAAPSALTLSVPYSFANVDKKLQSAVIACVARFGAKSPPVARGETTVVLNGHAKSGVAAIQVSALPGGTLAGAKYYSCAMALSDGHMVNMPPTLHPDTPLKWTVAKPGSTLEVSGEIR
jgi:hypothetical protein